MAALADDGIPGGPGIYSTRCPPLPRLRMKESRDVVHRATLKARGIDPDAQDGLKHARPVSKSGSRKGTPGDSNTALSLHGVSDAAGEMELDPLPMLNRLGGGGGGDYQSGSNAARYLTVAYEAKKMREWRKRELAKAGFSGHGSPVKSGTATSTGGGTVAGEAGAVAGDDADSVISMSDDRAAEASAAWSKAREDQTVVLYHATQAFNTVANHRRERESTLAKLELELDHLASTGVADFSDLEHRVEKLKVDFEAQVDQSEEEAERKHPIYLQIANRLRDGNLELKQGVEALKDVMKDVQADHDSCKEYERAALEAQKKGGEALEWIQQRYIAKVEGWNTELSKTKLERERLAEDVKNERTEDRDFKHRQGQDKLAREAKQKNMKRIAAGMLHEVEEKEMAEEVSRGALSQLAVTVGLDNPESCTPDEIVSALNKSRETKEKVAEQILDLQVTEAELWRQIMKDKEILQQVRLGLSQRMQARMQAAGVSDFPRMSMSSQLSLSRKSVSANGEGGTGSASSARSDDGRDVSVTEVEPDLATSREGYMDEMLLGKEKVLMFAFRNYNNSLVVLATFDEGLRAINDMVDTVVEAPKKSRAAAKAAAREAAKNAQGTAAAGRDSAAGDKAYAATYNGRDSTGMSESFSARKPRGSVSVASTGNGGSPRTSDATWGDKGSAVTFSEDVFDTSRDRVPSLGRASEGPSDITPLTMLFAQNAVGDAGAIDRRGASDMLAHYARLPEFVEATLTRLMDIIKHVPKEGRAARVSFVLGSTSVAKGGKGISIDHPLAGVGHKLGKVSTAMSEVDDDPGGMNAKRGKAYMEQTKKWCYQAGPPVESDEDEDDAAGGEVGFSVSGGMSNIHKVGSKLTSVSKFKRIGGKIRNGDPDAPMQVVKRGELKQESNRAQAKIDKANAPAGDPEIKG